MWPALCRCRSLSSYKPVPALCSVFGLSVDPSRSRRGAATQAIQADASSGGRRGAAHAGRAPPRGAQGGSKKTGRGNAEIYVSDLLPTLEAHRAKNRASLIRKVGVDGGRGVFRPEINYACPRFAGGGDGPEAQGGQGGTRPGSKDPPVDRLQKEWRRRAERLRLAGNSQMLGAAVGGTEGAEAPGRAGKIGLMREYRGVNFPPLPQHEMHWECKKDAAPWLRNLHRSDGGALLRLNDEIMAFEVYMSPTAAERASREGAVNHLRACAAVAAPDTFLEEYGSYNTGIYMPSSDIDLRLASPRQGKWPGERGPSLTRPSALREKHRQLRAFMSYLRSIDGYTDTGLIPARIPVGFTTHRATGIRFQITGAGEVNAHDEYVKTYLAEFPALRPLYFVINNMLWIRGFTETFTGGLGSYPLFMTIVAWLRLGKSQSITIWRHSNDSLGRDLLDFLEFYGSFNYYRQGLSVEPPRILTKGQPGGKPSKSQREAMVKDPVLGASSKMCVADKFQPYRLYLQDPANPLNDLGLKCYGIKHIRAIFQHTLTQLRRDMILYEQNPDLFERGGLLRSVVGGQFDWLERSRARDTAKEVSCT